MGTVRQLQNHSTPEQLHQIISKSVLRGDISVATVVGRQERQTLVDLAIGDCASGDSIFLIASISKPIICTSAVKLVEQGVIDLDDPVCRFVPEFGQNGKGDVLIRHLLTHTSGLPDMLTNNDELRRQSSPLSEFVAGVCRERLMFKPGANVSYQSMGILMLAEVLEQVTSIQLREFLDLEIFRPLGMSSTSLGWPKHLADRVITAGESSEPGAWAWNSHYWRNLGAPWGGVFSTAYDILRFLELFLDQGHSCSTHIIQPSTVQTMITDLTLGIKEWKESSVLSNGWGLGWQIQRRGARGFLGCRTPPGAFGHFGATGTLTWADPTSQTTFVMLTSGKMPTSRRTVKRCSDVIAAGIRSPANF